MTKGREPSAPAPAAWWLRSAACAEPVTDLAEELELRVRSLLGDLLGGACLVGLVGLDDEEVDDGGDDEERDERREEGADGHSAGLVRREVGRAAQLAE